MNILNNNKKKVIVVLPIVILLMGMFVTLESVMKSNNSDNSCTNNSQVMLTACSKITAKLTIIIYHKSDTFANPKLIVEGYTPSCWVLCNGITYTLDPTTKITNNGMDFLVQCKDFNTPKSITCTSSDFANYGMFSNSANTPAYTDTSCPATTITTGGLADTTLTVTAGTPSAGSLVTTLSHLYTAAETDTEVQMFCLNTEVHSGGNVVLVLSGQFGPDTLHSGDTITANVQLTTSY